MSASQFQIIKPVLVQFLDEDSNGKILEDRWFNVDGLVIQVLRRDPPDVFTTTGSGQRIRANPSVPPRDLEEYIQCSDFLTLQDSIGRRTVLVTFEHARGKIEAVGEFLSPKTLKLAPPNQPVGSLQVGQKYREY